VGDVSSWDAGPCERFTSIDGHEDALASASIASSFGLEELELLSLFLKVGAFSRKAWLVFSRAFFTEISIHSAALSSARFRNLPPRLTIIVSTIVRAIFGLSLRLACKYSG